MKSIDKKYKESIRHSHIRIKEGLIMKITE